jgi:hypothetical protein
MPDSLPPEGQTGVDKLPVPGPWRAPVRRAMADLAARSGLPPASVAPTRVEEAEWLEAGERRRGLEIWLLGAGRSHRYRAEFGSDSVERLGGA